MAAPQREPLRILLLGNGGREHALAHTLAQSPLVERIAVAPGNGGTARGVPKTQNLDIGSGKKDWERLVQWAVQEKINLVVPGPEQPLVDGIEPFFRRVGIPVFGPSPAAAAMEGSKTLSKDFMARHAIPTASYENFTTAQAEEAKRYIREAYARGEELVIKASGLAAGKGVLIPASEAEALEGVEDILEKGVFGEAGSSLVLESLLTGPEISVLAFSDGYTVAALPGAQDHKRIGEGDTGLNTGGMGAYSPAPAETPAIRQQLVDIVERSVAGMRRDGFPFVGLLFVGFMVTPQGPKVLEYNVRFGDPETQALLRLLAPGTDLAEIMLACVERRLDSVKIEVRNDHAVSIVLASAGYPGKYPTGVPITIGELPQDVIAFHAGTALDTKGQLVTAGGRVIAVSAFGSTLREALDKAYAGVDKISFEGKTFRKDIAHRALAAQSESKDGGLTYAQAGVSIEEGNRLVDLIKPVVKATRRSGADAVIGGFGGVFDLKAAGFRDPVLVSGTDGVGTKIKIAHATGIHDTVGIDLVAMSVNDLIVQGAEPLYFLDYFACSKLKVEDAAAVIKGIAQGCQESGCALIGGETAEMPGLYEGDDYDLAGFAVGAVERDHILPLHNIAAGDVLIGVSSSGIHSNGFSLVHKVLERSLGPSFSYSSPAPWDASQSLARALLTPTKLYIKPLLPAVRAGLLKGMSHITGGGFTENVPRVLPKGLGAWIDATRWTRPAVFDWIQREGGVKSAEMARAFNNGIGMVLVVEKGKVEEVLKNVREQGEQGVWVIGEVKEGEGVEMRGFEAWEKRA